MHHLVQTAMKDPPARPGPPAEPAPDEKALRAELRHAQEIHKGAAARAELAAAAESRAAAALRDAEGETARLEAQQQRASDIATERHAKAAADALRAGSPVPVATTLPDSMNTACLAAAKAQQAILAKALTELAAESASAKSEAGRAAAGVALKVDAVVMCTAKRLAGEYAAIVEMYTAFTDKLSGLQLFGRERQGRECFDELVAETLARTDRRHQARLADPRMSEDWKYQDLLTRHAKAGQARWRDFAARLATDSTAQFDLSGANVEQ